MKEKDKREVILHYFEAGKTASEAVVAVKTLGISRTAVYENYKKFRSGLGIDRRKGSGRKRSLANIRGTYLIERRIARNPKQSVRKIGRDLVLPKTTAHRITQKYLGLVGRKKQRRQLLTDEHKLKRKTICYQLLQKTANAWHRKVLFSDEKNFILQQPLNPQNDRIYVEKDGEKDVQESSVFRQKFPQKLMVWLGCARGVKSKPIF